MNQKEGWKGWFLLPQPLFYSSHIYLKKVGCRRTCGTHFNNFGQSIVIAPKIKNQFFPHKKVTRASAIPAVLYSTVQSVLLCAQYRTCSAVHRDRKRYDRVNNVCVKF